MTIIKRIAAAIFFLIYIPVFFSVVFIGNRANYPDYYKLDTIVPGVVLFVAALLLAVVFFYVKKGFDKIAVTTKSNLILDAVLALLFVVITIVNIKLCKSIVFVTGWADPVNAQYSGLRIIEGVSINEGTWYYLLCSNNVPIAWICSLILRLYRMLPDFLYKSDFFVIEVNCVIISLTGFFTCLSVKKLTRNFGSTVVAFLIYAGLICVSPWKLIFYTDTAGMLLPIVTFYLYLFYKEKEGVVKYIFAFSMALTGIFAGFIKPTAYTCLIAIVIIEICTLIFDKNGVSLKKKLCDTSVMLAFICVAYLLINVALLGHIYKVSGFTPDKDLEGTWSYYLNMGSNEEYMGTNNPVDSGLLVGEYSGRPGSERRAAELNSFMSRTRERGFFGNLSFWNRKLTMTFNDGTFSWFKEGLAAFWSGEYDDISANPNKELLRHIFWGDGEYYNYFETYAQWLWFFVLTGLTGLLTALFRKDKPKALLLTVICIGVILFQMLFETRARYLICSLPLLMVASIEGYNSIYATLREGYTTLKKQNKEKVR